MNKKNKNKHLKTCFQIQSFITYVELPIFDDLLLFFVKLGLTRIFVFVITTFNTYKHINCF